ncbi:MAG: cyclase family protein [Bacteroidota bacterium]
MKKFFLLFFLPALISCKQDHLSDQLQSSRWVDLTHDYDSGTVYWPTNIPFHHDTVSCGINDQGYYYSSFKYSAEEHGGTHFDAPLHFSEGGKSIEKISVGQLHGPGVTIDVTSQCLTDRDYQIKLQDLENWENQNGRIPDGSIILFYTGFGTYWNDHLKYTGTLKSGKEGVSEIHFPGLSPGAAQWLADNRKINAVGLDTPSIDFGQSKDFMTHRILCKNQLTIYENLANLDQVPPRGAYIVALPMKIKGGSGAPLRIVAIFAQ